MDTQATTEATQAETIEATDTQATTEQSTEAQPAPTDGLADAMAEHAAELREALGGKKTEEQVAETAETQEAKPDGETDEVEAKTEGEKEVETSTEAKTEESREEEKPAEDEVAKRLARYVRQHEKATAREKEAKAAAEKAEAERQALAQEREQLAKSQAIVSELSNLAAANPIDAIEYLLGTQALVAEDSDLVGGLLERIAQRRSGAPVVSDDQKIAEAVKRALEADRSTRETAEKEAARKAQEEKAAQTERNKAAFFSGLQAHFEEKADKYPFIQDDPIDTEEVDAWMFQQFNTTGKIPSGDEILDHFEREREEQALRRVAVLEKTGKLPKKSPNAQPAAKNPSAAAASGVDTRGKPSKPVADESLEEKRERIARELDAQFRG